MENEPFNPEPVISEFKTASDRAAAIVGGAFLDDLLIELLKSFFIKDAKSNKKLFEGNGCLATFSSRIDLSYRLGLIAKAEHRALHTVREIRNRFAHQMGAASFQRQDIKDLCANIEKPKSMVAPKFVPLSMKGEVPPLPKIEKAESNNPRAVFEESVIVQMHQIAARVATATISSRKCPSEFSSAIEIARCMLEVFENQLLKHDELLGKVDSSSELPKMDYEARKRYQILIEIQRFCVQQMEKAHCAE